MVDFKAVFGMDSESVKAREESAKVIQEQAIAEKWCCTCEYYIPVDPELPGFVTAFSECEHGGIAENTCDRYRLKGTGIRSSAWADGIRQRFMKMV